MDLARVGLLGEDVVSRHGRVVELPEEFPVVVVVPELQPDASGLASGPVQILGKGAPDRGVTNHLAGREVDAEERHHNILRLQCQRVVQGPAPCHGIERLRDSMWFELAQIPLSSRISLNWRL